MTLGSIDAGRRRTFFEIIAEILRACGTNSRKTTLMCHCSMSYVQLTRYLDLMLGANLLLVENNNEDVMFRISSKGRYFIKAYEDLKSLME